MKDHEEKLIKKLVETPDRDGDNINELNYKSGDNEIDFLIYEIKRCHFDFIITFYRTSYVYEITGTNEKKYDLNGVKPFVHLSRYDDLCLIRYDENDFFRKAPVFQNFIEKLRQENKERVLNMIEEYVITNN